MGIKIDAETGRARRLISEFWEFGVWGLLFRLKTARRPVVQNLCESPMTLRLVTLNLLEHRCQHSAPATAWHSSVVQTSPNACIAFSAWQTFDAALTRHTCTKAAYGNEVAAQVPCRGSCAVSLPPSNRINPFSVQRCHGACTHQHTSQPCHTRHSPCVP